MQSSLPMKYKNDFIIKYSARNYLLVAEKNNPDHNCPVGTTYYGKYIYSNTYSFCFCSKI